MGHGESKSPQKPLREGSGSAVQIRVPKSHLVCETCATIISWSMYREKKKETTQARRCKNHCAPCTERETKKERERGGGGAREP